MTARLAALALVLASLPAGALEVVTLGSKAPLVELKVLVRAGSGQDPEGLEGLAGLTGRLLIEGSFGDPKAPVTKERLAELTRPWGSLAMPRLEVGKETTVFSFTAPREAFELYLSSIVEPMFGRPLFDAKELERLRGEQLQGLRSNLRLEQIELLGLTALDNAVYERTPYAHPELGTEKGLSAVQRDHAARFYKTYYGPAVMTAGLSADEPALVEALRRALEGAGRFDVSTLPRREAKEPAPVRGRDALIVALPNAIATGLHAGFPIEVTRKHPDYWPLYVANVWFGAHRDGFSHLYQVLREERGYNYGDYSYIEHFEGRPFHLFMPFNHPRRLQYFSLWIRPVAHEYAPHVAKALSWELERFVRDGLSEEQCALSKNKARVLYLSLAETGERLLASRLDDAFYGLEEGWLAGYLKNIDAVACADVNAAIRRHLQAENLKLVLVTDDDAAAKLRKALAEGDRPLWGKGPADYQIDVKEADGQKLFMLPESKLDIVRLDAAWAYHPLRLAADRIRVVPAEKMFETADLPR